jgi:hypothetical protein
MITATDKRTPTASFSTGTPKPPEAGDTVMVQPTTTYMHGSEIVGPHSPPYPLSLHLANELKSHGFAKILPAAPAPIDPPRDPEDDTVEIEEEVEEEIEEEQPDDQARAPDQNQNTASTVPARAGAEPARPPSGPIPPAATSEAPKPRGRRAARRAAAVE